MGFNILNIVESVILLFITLLIFTFTYLIYKRTEGASLAYKKWATATLVLFFARITFLIIFILDGFEVISSIQKEGMKNIGRGINIAGYFFLPIGAIYLSKDMGFREINQKFIQNLKLVFFTSIIIICSFFFFLLVILETDTFSKLSISTFNLLNSIVFAFTIYHFRPIQKQLKDTNSCWNILYVGLFAAFGNDFAGIFTYLSFYIELLSIILQLIMALCFIFGFYKLAKLVEAI